jgi:hypothetical protein
MVFMVGLFASTGDVAACAGCHIGVLILFAAWPWCCTGNPGRVIWILTGGDSARPLLFVIAMLTFGLFTCAITWPS